MQKFKGLCNFNLELIVDIHPTTDSNSYDIYPDLVDGKKKSQSFDISKI